MSYKKDAILQIKEEEKIKKMSKLLEKKLKEMTQEQRQEFVNKLMNKIKIIDAELKDISNNNDELNKRQKCRNLSDDCFGIFCGVFAILGAIAGGIVFANVTAIAMVNIGLILLSAFVGTIASVPVFALINNKVISNLLASIKGKINHNKQNKLNGKRNLVNQQLKVAEEIERQY